MGAIDSKLDLRTSDTQALQTALSLSLEVIFKLGSKLSESYQDDKESLNELETIDSLPSLIELLGFLHSDQLNMMVTHKRILELLQ